LLERNGPSSLKRIQDGKETMRTAADSVSGQERAALKRRRAPGCRWLRGMLLGALGLLLMEAGKGWGAGANNIPAPDSMPALTLDAAESPNSSGVLDPTNAFRASPPETNTNPQYVLPEGDTVKGWTPPPPRAVVPRSLATPDSDSPVTNDSESALEQGGWPLTLALVLLVGLALIAVIGRFRHR
jgi:hypothetical protein